MKPLTLPALAALLVCAPAAPLLAHHGSAGTYDMKTIVTVKGTVKEFLWRNPHSALFLEGRDASGKPVTYSIEMGSPATLANMGFRRTTFKAGDEAALEAYPAWTNHTSFYSISSHQVTVNGKPLHDPSAAAPRARGDAQ